MERKTCFSLYANIQEPRALELAALEIKMNILFALWTFLVEPNQYVKWNFGPGRMAAFHNFCLICYQQICGEKKERVKKRENKDPGIFRVHIPSSGCNWQENWQRPRLYSLACCYCLYSTPTKKKVSESQKNKKKANKKLEECRIVRPKSYTPLQKGLVFDRALPFLVVHA